MIDCITFACSRVYPACFKKTRHPIRLPAFQLASWVSLKPLRSWIWKDLSSSSPQKRLQKLNEIKEKLKKHEMCDQLLSLDENIYVIGLIQKAYNGDLTLTDFEKDFITHLQTNKFITIDLSATKSQEISSSFKNYLIYMRKLKDQNEFFSFKTQSKTEVKLKHVLKYLVVLKPFISPALLLPRLQDKKEMIHLNKQYDDLFIFLDEFYTDDTEEEASRYFNDFAQIFCDPVQTKVFKKLGSFNAVTPFTFSGFVTSWGLLGSSTEEEHTTSFFSHRFYFSLKELRNSGEVFTPASIQSFHQRLLNNEVSFSELLKWKKLIRPIESQLTHLTDKLKEGDIQNSTAKALFNIIRTIAKLVNEDSSYQEDLDLDSSDHEILHSKIALVTDSEKIVKIRGKLLRGDSLETKEEFSLLLNMLACVSITDKDKLGECHSLDNPHKNELLQWHALFKREEINWKNLTKLQSFLKFMTDDEIKQAITKLKIISEKDDKSLKIISETADKLLKIEDRWTVKECKFLLIALECLPNGSTQIKFKEHLWISLNHKLLPSYRVCIVNLTKNREKLKLIEEPTSFLSRLAHRINVLFARIYAFFLSYGYVDLVRYDNEEKKFIIRGINPNHNDPEILKYNPCLDEFKIKPTVLMPPDSERTKAAKTKFKATFFKHLRDIMETPPKPTYGERSYLLRVIKAKLFSRKVTPLELDINPSKEVVCSQYIGESIIRATVCTYKDYHYQVPDSLTFFGFKEREDLNGLIPKRLREVFLGKGILKPAFMPYS